MKSKLKDYDIAVHRNGASRIVLGTELRNGIYAKPINNFTEDLRDMEAPDNDIMKVIRGNNIIWERTELNYTLPELLKACKDVVGARYNKDNSLAIAISNLRDLIGE